MTAETEGQSPFRREWHVIARQAYLLEAVAPFELGQRSAVPPHVNETLKAFTGTDLNGLGYQHVVRAFVAVTDFRENLSRHSVVIGDPQHQETYEFGPVECADQFLSK